MPSTLVLDVVEPVEDRPVLPQRHLVLDDGGRGVLVGSVSRHLQS